jgi:AcrR family transcriptional regulator
MPLGSLGQTVRPPKQQRSRESYERVLHAAHQLLEENGFEGFTVQEVATRANVSVGAIYERFGNKETLLHAVHERLMDTIAQFVDSQQAALPSGVGDLIEALVQRVAATMAAHHAILRAFMHLGALDEVIADRGSLESIELGRHFKAALRPHAAELAHPDAEIALDVAFRIAYSTLARQVMYGPLFESDVALGWEQLTGELAHACRAYLLA